MSPQRPHSGVQAAGWLSTLFGLGIAATPVVAGESGPGLWNALVAGLVVAVASAWMGWRAGLGVERVLGAALLALVAAVWAVVGAWAFATAVGVRWVLLLLGGLVVLACAWAMREAQNARAHVRW